MHKWLVGGGEVRGRLDVMDMLWLDKSVLVPRRRREIGSIR